MRSDLSDLLADAAARMKGQAPGEDEEDEEQGTNSPHLLPLARSQEPERSDALFIAQTREIRNSTCLFAQDRARLGVTARSHIWAIRNRKARKWVPD